MAATDWGPFGLQGQVAVVTGAAAGIGRGVTDRFSEAGAAVLLVDQDDEGLANAVGSLKRNGAQVGAFEADITAPGAGEAVVEHCRQTLGEIDVLVNNAGIYPMIAMADLSDEAIDRILGLNLVAAMLMARAVAARMIDRNAGGAIINVASIDGVRPSSPGFLAYCASKGGCWPRLGRSRSSSARTASGSMPYRPEACSLRASGGDWQRYPRSTSRQPSKR